jgi:MOSC domain-containing protein YiiM
VWPTPCISVLGIDRSRWPVYCGVYAEVLAGGVLRTGDTLRVIG